MTSTLEQVQQIEAIAAKLYQEPLGINGTLSMPHCKRLGLIVLRHHRNGDRGFIRLIHGDSGDVPSGIVFQTLEEFYRQWDVDEFSFEELAEYTEIINSDPSHLLLLVTWTKQRHGQLPLSHALGGDDA